MPLVPFLSFLGFFEFGQGHRGPMIPYCPGPHEWSVRPWLGPVTAKQMKYMRLILQLPKILAFL
ncbi:unnamed protein product [Staurois parvus]|uniref:Uncharacterized protein n=1 Tax=Staurois parvus TaxID=386267 RepID=A0ABN9CV83_9NEOB|nr:unnamed protein product [Staurois parvus]